MNRVSLPSIGVLALLAASLPVSAQPALPAALGGCAAHVSEAASRSGLSAVIILRVMLAESGGNPRIVSPKGAIGCMQIMPGTWAYLSPRYNLGADPFEARRNMIGGAMYLAELVARYGMPGALAAYNAGPGRYERYAAGTARLPAETIAYTARIGTGPLARATGVSAARWQEASLFLTRNAQTSPPAAQTPTIAKDGRASRMTLFPLAASGGDDETDPVGP